MISIRKNAGVAGVLTLGAVGVAAVPATAAAAGFYLGADFVQLSTELDYGATEKYSTTHARLRAGYEIHDTIAVEMHILTAGDDTDIDFLGNTFRLDTGTIVGIYAKPKSGGRKASVYGLIGFSMWDTSYGPNGFSFLDDTDNVLTLGLGVGGDFNITRNLRFNIEGMMHIGSADYDFWIGTDTDFVSLGIAAGVNYQF
ncbi:MAG TPA: outer membrane beta-barrel protein [Acidiferrobacterales bacterium]|jgi:hypothetical protein